MFINFLIVIFTVFIVYLLFSTSTFQEGMKKKGGKKLKIGKKGGLKKRAKKAKKKVKEAIEDGKEAVDDAMDDGEDAVKEAVDDAGVPLPTAAQLPRMVNDLKSQMRDVRTQVASLLAEKPTMASSTMDEEEEDGDLGV